MQIERLLQSQGFGSRKDCRVLVRQGRFSIDGVVEDDPFAEVDPGSKDGEPGLAFSVAGERWHYRANAYLMLHKPVGYECSHQPIHHPSIFSLLPPPLLRRGVQAVGRLDQDTSGLLLLADDGQFIHRWSSGRKQTPKLYLAELKHDADETLVSHLLEGVQLHDEKQPLAAASARLLEARKLELSILEGKYHQVKRMVAAAGNRVVGLHRHRIGGLELDPALAPGQWRWLNKNDLTVLPGFTPAAT